jgi:hypothetical protein
MHTSTPSGLAGLNCRAARNYPVLPGFTEARYAVVHVVRAKVGRPKQGVGPDYLIFAAGITISGRQVMAGDETT